eukprot:gnl/TRDRNA2_/TRDRNA2_128912_c0_seq1.p1 gnl/TRDRNA2_/TRDRNA2_128912_c0~~gnl/TRDRNA2_/TRDRNA2_128912_c0_seq1.p1  ORF type:complete len:370 (-),score=99.23 gnl/TRDRNA2_/TRDRNA2_128912_c0_seq1:108-1217(-)
MEEWESSTDTVLVRRTLLQEVLRDGTCPVHLRVQLAAALRQAETADEVRANGSFAIGTPLACIDGRCLALVASSLPLAEVLNTRATALGGLAWVMRRAAAEAEAAETAHKGREARGPATALRKVHDRIRTRLWVRRIDELTTGTNDETVFVTAMRSFADDALRRRMEAEMRESRAQMEREIHLFHDEIDHRIEEQVARARSMAEEHVLMHLDMIRAEESERAELRANARVRERVMQALEAQAELSNIWNPAVKEQIAEVRALLRYLWACITGAASVLPVARAGCRRRYGNASRVKACELEPTAASTPAAAVTLELCAQPPMEEPGSSPPLLDVEETGAEEVVESELQSQTSSIWASDASEASDMDEAEA